MIEFTKAWKATDGTPFFTLKEVKHHEIKLLYTEDGVANGGAAESDAFAAAVIRHADKIVDILTTGPRSILKARKSHGGSKPRKSNVVPFPGLQSTVPRE